ncbi:MAG: hypothetical protein V1820_04795 [archaeon]
MAISVEAVLQGASLALGLASAVIAVLMLIRVKNENTEVSWRFLIAAAVVFAIAQAFTLLEAWKLPGTEAILTYEPEAAYLVFALLFLLGISRQHQVTRNSDLD